MFTDILILTYDDFIGNIKVQLCGFLSRAVFGCQGTESLDPTHPNPTLVHPAFKGFFQELCVERFNCRGFFPRVTMTFPGR